MDAVAVVVPTLRRPESLERALRSLFMQQSVAGRLVEIVVVDNDPAQTAHRMVDALQTACPCRLLYVSAPKPGVATARNAGLAATQAPLIAFLDDDEAASPAWLCALIDVHEACGADVVFGPIQGRAPGAPAWLSEFLESFFSRAGPATSGPTQTVHGCGNSLMRRETALPGPAPFDTAADESGGEDDVLFARLRTQGRRFAWAADAWVEEFAPPHRATLRYTLTRAFAYGQGPSQTAASAGDWLSVARWMAIGAAQAAVWGAAAAVSWTLRQPRRAFALDRAVRGLGKVFWMSGLEPSFYGERELARRVAGEAVSPSAAAGTSAAHRSSG